MGLVLLYRYGLGTVFLLGFTGNVASMATFLRPSLRNTSTGFLFWLLSVSDTIFLLVSIFDFIEVGITQAPIFLPSYDNLCRLRGFTKGTIQFCSAWILTSVAIDRWLRARYPFKTKQWCTRRNAFIVTVVILIVGASLHSFTLKAEFFGKRFAGIATESCGPPSLRGVFNRFYFSQWPYIQVGDSHLVDAMTECSSLCRRRFLSV